MNVKLGGETDQQNVFVHKAYYEVGALGETLAMFCAELRREDKQDHEPGSLKVMQASLERHLKELGYPKSIIKDREFINSQFHCSLKVTKLLHETEAKVVLAQLEK